MASVQRLSAFLASAGVPVDVVTITGPTSANVTYQPDATSDQIQLGVEILATFDWSDAAETDFVASLQRAVATAIVLTGEDPISRATRGGDYALMISLQEARVKINEIITQVNTATGSTIVLLETGDTFDDAMNSVVELINAGIV